MSKNTKPVWGKSFTTSPGRLVFPNIARPSGIPGSVEKYSASIVVKEDSKLAEIQDEIDRVGREAFKDWDTGNFHTPIIKGEEVIERSDGKAPEGLYAGKYRILAKANKDKPAPIVYLADKSKLPRRPGVESDLDQIEKVLYAGCYARLVVSVYSYDKMKQRGVGLMLKAVQFVQDGPPIGGINTDAMIEEDYGSFNPEDSNIPE